VNILGISAYYHDAAACLVRDGVIVAAAQEERFTRKKRDDSFPRNAIRYCMDVAGGPGTKLDAVAFYDKPIDKFVRILKTHLAIAPRGLRAFLKAMPRWVQRNLWVRLEITQALQELGFDSPDQIFFTEHHEAHAASAFFPSPFPEAAIVTLDGVGEWPTGTIGIGEGNRIGILREQNFPHSLGLLYSAFTYYTGFAVNADEYKLMGLAPYGQPRYTKQIFEKLVSLHADGSFRLNMEYFNFLGGLTMTNDAFADLFEGPVRAPSAEITQHTQDVARSAQEATEQIVRCIVDEAHRITGQQALCLAGGVALNCVANGRLLREGPFRSIWVAPASHDAGGAVGGALAAWHQFMEKPRLADGKTDGMRGSYLGPGFSEAEIEAMLVEKGVRFRKLEESEWAQTIAELLEDGSILGLFRGRMEFGPRALGNRSILADPRRSDVASRINQSIKFRESFRPFAPAVLEEHAAEYFDLPAPSPYMLFTAPVTQAHRTDLAPDDPTASLTDRLARVRSDLPGVTHIDYSARVQTVARQTNPAFHALIDAFRKRTGCPVLVNTSFNVRGEPIVCTPEEAYSCFMKTRMDHLVLESYLLSKELT
jgi:carbamoyltransferase